MSVESNIYEKMTIHNTNDKTAKLAKAVGEYISQVFAPDALALEVDRKKYFYRGTPLSKKILAVCKELHTAKEITFCMDSSNYGGISWQKESGFLKILTEDPELLNTVEYRGRECCEESVILCRYDQRGYSDLKNEYTTDISVVKGISFWGCDLPRIHLYPEKQKDSNTYMLLLDCLKSIADLTWSESSFQEDKDAFVVDDWESCGDIVYDHCMSFSNENISELINALQRLVDISIKNNINISLDVAAAPIGENDYGFAAMAISLENGKVIAEYCRF